LHIFVGTPPTAKTTSTAILSGIPNVNGKSCYKLPQFRSSLATTTSC
jgi:hypothetical protein